MHTRFMVQLDKRFGPPVCAALRYWAGAERLVRRLFKRPSLSGPVRRVLVIKCFGIGSVLLSTPMLKALKQSYPDARVTYFTFLSNKAICRFIPQIDEILTVDTRTPVVFAVSFLGALLRLRRSRFDTVIDLEFFARFSSAISYLSGARRRIGFYLNAPWREGLLTDMVPLNHTCNVREAFSHLIKPLGIETRDLSIKLPETKEDTRIQVRRMLGHEGHPGLWPRIAVNINTSDLAYERRWPRAYFVELVSALRRLHGAQIILIGGSADGIYTSDFMRLLDDPYDVVNLAGQLTIAQLIALFRDADLVISNDSGPLQVAIASGARTLSLFGPETPRFYGPLEKGHRVFYEGIFCSPCLNVYSAKMTACDGDNICMKQIKPGRVIAAAREMLLEMGFRTRSSDIIGVSAGAVIREHCTA